MPSNIFYFKYILFHLMEYLMEWNCWLPQIMFSNKCCLSLLSKRVLPHQTFSYFTSTWTSAYNQIFYDVILKPFLPCELSDIPPPPRLTSNFPISTLCWVSMMMIYPQLMFLCQSIKMHFSSSDGRHNFSLRFLQL